jgi:hypothetical protein
MKASRALLLGVCAIAAPLAIAAVRANAAEPSPQQIVVYDFAGHPVGVLTPFAATAQVQQQLRPSAVESVFDRDPFAQMDAMMNAMMVRMDRLAAMPFPDGAAGPITIGMPDVPSGPGQVFISTYSSGGHGSCSQTITYRSDGSGQPKVDVRQVGDACGAIAAPGGRPIPAALPEAQPEIVAPSVTAPGERVYNIDYRRPVKGKPALHG